MKVLVLGASGILGQHLRLCCPSGIDAVYARKTADVLHVGLDLTDNSALAAFLDRESPDVIINLAGESSTDRAEDDPSAHWINAVLPFYLAKFCQKEGTHLIQVSSQAVFGGDDPPYDPSSICAPVNAYGRQKRLAEEQVMSSGCNWTIVRPTFVLGFRPLPHVGRPNPLEQILAGQRKQVNDRWFSISLAGEVAELLWKCAVERTQGIIHIGEGRLSRYDIACIIGKHAVEPVSHDSFPGLAPRPVDTSYTLEADDILGRLDEVRRGAGDELRKRAREIALFFGRREEECYARLNVDWPTIHNAVTAHWNLVDPQTDEQILDWYRCTVTYIWELSWYHADKGFNYKGMCNGIAERLKAAGAQRALCIGDGIGDATLILRRAGIDATYHDLEGSRTAAFAAFRSWMHTGEYMPTRLSKGWEPDLGTEEWDVIVALDFVEHVTDVPAWAAAIKGALKPGGLLVAQNAFGIGSEGAMPMHLARNDRFEKDWDPLLAELGFVQESSNWYKVPA